MKWFVEKLVGVPEQMWYPDSQTTRPRDRIQATVALLRQHRVCYLWDIVQKQDWDIFLELATDLPASVLITNGTPPEWGRPPNLTTVTWPSEMWTHAEHLRLMRLRGQLRTPRTDSATDHTFSLAFSPQDIHQAETQANRDPGRLAWVKTAHDHGLLDRACYSTPAIDGAQIQVSPAPEGYDVHQGSVPVRYFDHPQSRSQIMDTTHSVQSLAAVTEGCSFHVLLDSEFDQGRCVSLGLRHLQAMTVGRATYAVTTPEILAEMHRWGIQTLNQTAPPRDLWSHVRHTQAEIRHILAQSSHGYWQRHAQAQARHNHGLIRDLPHRIEQWVWDQCQAMKF